MATEKNITELSEATVGAIADRYHVSQSSVDKQISGAILCDFVEETVGDDANTAEKLVKRDASGNAKVSDPVVDSDIDTKGARDGKIEEYTQDKDFEAGSIYRTSAGVESAITIKRKIIEIGIWNMDSTIEKMVDIGFRTITEMEKILSVSVIIFNDELNHARRIEAGFINESSGYFDIAILTARIFLRRMSSGAFDSTSYDDEVINRGFVYIEYMA